ncbi:hypothetical protein HDU91_005995 [Kappamyces sp. JEL0680]|nr:hypothetical protein HDU91_005995 [Kappamyces sp. JEL0680]
MERTNSEATIPMTPDAGPEKGDEMQEKYKSSIKIPDAQKVIASTVFTWQISNWTEAKKAEKLYSPPFKTEPNSRHSWRLMIFPNGNKSPDVVSAFLECINDDHAKAVQGLDASADAKTISEKENPFLKWHVCGYFALSCSNSSRPEIFTPPTNAQHRFTIKETDWGFSSFIHHSNLLKVSEERSHPILENDGFSITVFVKEVEDETGTLWHNFIDWDSKAETGYVGLKNQGATCYLNSLVQSLYFTNYFRKATYAIPTQNQEPQKSVPYALQRLFYHMQFADDAVGTNELTKSFGWDTMDAFYQHDVQELNRVLQDNLENTMKGTPVEGAIKKLFTAKMKSYITCVNVRFESSRVEEYYDIQLNVKGCKDLHASFVEYCKVEMLDGDNKYFAEGFGLQDAKKGVIFESFPRVLHLQLKRFDYDMERDQFVKINDRHEFPDTIDLSEFLSEEADKSVRQVYRLQGVLVHSGDLNAGHYYALIRPKKGGTWFKFDDDKVVPAAKRDVFEANFGGEPFQVGGGRPGMMKHRFYTNAYMLVYVRESDEDEVLQEVTEEDIPLHLRERVKQDIDDAKAREIEAMERHLYMNVQVVNDNDLLTHSGFDIGFTNDRNKTTTSSVAHNFRVKKEMTLAKFLDHYAKEVGLPPAQICLWRTALRQNKTCRAEMPFPQDKLNVALSDVLALVGKQQEELRLYAQISHVAISPGQFFAPKTPSSILIFIKEYKPLSGAMR